MTAAKKLATFAFIAGIAGAPALAANDLSAFDIAKIDVTTDLTAIKNEKAAAYWANVEQDLEAAIAGKATDRLSDEGLEIEIDINELALANAYERELGFGEAAMVGDIVVLREVVYNKTPSKTAERRYELTVNVENSKIDLKPGEKLVLSRTDTPETYRMLIDTFAESVIKRLN